MLLVTKRMSPKNVMDFRFDVKISMITIMNRCFCFASRRTLLDIEYCRKTRLRRMKHRGAIYKWIGLDGMFKLITLLF